MKKQLAILLMIVLVLSLCACGSTGQASTKKDETPATNSNSEGKTDIPAKTEVPETTKEPEVSYTISDEVIVDDENCTFKITRAEVDKIWGFTLKAYCENKTSDKTLMFSIDDVSVNGYMVDPFWAEEVAPGKKSNDDITFSSTSFKDNGITTADEITFILRVYDSNDWGADDYIRDTFTIYPTGLDSNTVVYPERRSTASEQVIIDNETICFVILDQEDDNIWGYTLNCYLENKTDKTLMFTWDDVSVNGFMLDPFWARSVAPGMRSYSGISFSSSGFEENGITDVEEIEYTMRVYDSNDWLGEDVFKDTLTYKP